jgi:hypothetical protein
MNNKKDNNFRTEDVLGYLLHEIKNEATIDEIEEKITQMLVGLTDRNFEEICSEFGIEPTR